jgi:hypothetical protein
MRSMRRVGCPSVKQLGVEVVGRPCSVPLRFVAIRLEAWNAQPLCGSAGVTHVLGLMLSG